MQGMFGKSRVTPRINQTYPLMGIFNRKYQNKSTTFIVSSFKLKSEKTCKYKTSLHKTRNTTHQNYIKCQLHILHNLTACPTYQNIFSCFYPYRFFECHFTLIFFCSESVTWSSGVPCSVVIQSRLWLRRRRDI